ncbi:NUDIX domain-containing protein [Halococcus saccharolyticus]|uniref:Nudix family protein n=1 Tax=Halococcus saccharolyticus DSM 5350 TaxID=1227455 RepID=M0MG78_9EURY|nr:NUDIX domain-containing protein [Halococcus saccharolyticus]EMA44711.1 nudix family protein [Halococcus saccharolyticus DSM 5350]
MTLDELWFLADEADQRAARAYHDLLDGREPTMETTHHRRVSRGRFRTLAERIRETGAPYGAHTIVYRPSGELLLCRHDGVGLWVLPGGEIDGNEGFRAAAERELAEEAGIEANYDGLAIAARIEVRCDDHATWGVMPVFAAAAETTTTTMVADPDDEISAAEWFDNLPDDTRDREDLVAWRERVL